MPSRSIEAALGAAGLIAGLVGLRTIPFTTSQAAAPADTLSPAWIESVTMEPIRVVVSRETRLEAVTMEPIRVVIPLAKDSAPQDPKASPRR